MVVVWCHGYSRGNCGNNECSCSGNGSYGDSIDGDGGGGSGGNNNGGSENMKSNGSSMKIVIL